MSDEGRTGDDVAGRWRIDRESATRPDGLKGFFYWWLESDENDRRAYVDANSSTVTVEELRRALLDEDRISLLGVERSGEKEPTLNPELHVTVHGDDVLYCLVSQS